MWLPFGGREVNPITRVTEIIHCLEQEVFGTTSPAIVAGDNLVSPTPEPLLYCPPAPNYPLLPYLGEIPELAHNIPETGVYVIWGDSLVRRVVNDPRSIDPTLIFPLTFLLMEYAVRHVWERVQWEQESTCPPTRSRQKLRLTTDDVLSAGKSYCILDRVTIDWFRQRCQRTLDENDRLFYRRIFQDNSRWRQQRGVECRWIAEVFTCCSEIENCSAFLKKLVERARQKALNT